MTFMKMSKTDFESKGQMIWYLKKKKSPCFLFNTRNVGKTLFYIMVIMGPCVS